MKSALRWTSAAWIATGVSAALSSKNMPASHDSFTMSANDHAGLGQRTRVIAKIVGGKRKLSGD
ncbi:hypothetical protein ACAX43_22965 [Paraburkholderia sp. IW21]|uniref:hypothetical protein n=1 Tax=Paraburkholderia sp. IW21 TaxID=3242488 RepID=UPI00352145ED